MTEETINRSNWDKHPKFHSGGASKLIYFHSHFRESMKDILALIEKENYKRAKKQFIELESHLEMHHHIEEQSIFPYLKKYITEKESKQLFGDHKVLTKHLDKLTKMFEKEIKKEELVEEFTQFQKDTEKHLNDEEDICIPVFITHNFRI